MNVNYYDIIIIASLVLCCIFLILSVVLFFKFRIPAVVRNLRGTLEQKQIEKIRDKSSDGANRRGSVNVFEELEQRAKPRINNTQRIKLQTTTDSLKDKDEAAGTTVLTKPAKAINKDFIIEKNIIFVSTNEILK